MPIGLFPGIDDSGKDTVAGNVMLRRVKDFDWSSTSIGGIEHWPGDLRSVCRTTLLSSTPMSVLIGTEGLVLYNDAARLVFGPGFDDALGRPIAEALPDAADFCRRMLARIFAGRSSNFRDLPVTLHRDGRWQKAWFDLDFTPITDTHRHVHGALVMSIETTARVQALLNLQTSREKLDLALVSGGIVGTWEIDFRTETVRADECFSRLHGVDPDIAKVGADRALFIAGIHPDDREKVMAAFDHAKIDGNYRCQHRVVGFEGTRWIVASGHVRHKSDGSALSFTGTAVDVTEQITTTAALTVSEKRFRAYTETLPHIVFSWDRDGQTIYINRRWYEFTGYDEGAADPYDWQSFIHPDDKTLVIADWRRALETGMKYDAVSRHRHHSGNYRWMHAVALPIRDEEGRIANWIGTLTDVHEATLLETERELVSKELDHRIKNFFAVAQSLVSLTLHENHTVAAFAERLRGRLATLHRSHSFIRAGSGAAAPQTGHSLHELIRLLLEPYDVAILGGRLTIEGDDIAVEPGKITAFALVFHELATNAAKYGALCTPEGAIRLLSSPEEDRLRLIWKENGGIAPSEPEADGGFGSRLMHLVVEGQLRGRFSSVAEPDGLRVILDVPMENSGRLQR